MSHRSYAFLNLTYGPRRKAQGVRESRWRRQQGAGEKTEEDSTLTEEGREGSRRERERESVQTTLRTCPGLMGYSGDPCRHRGREAVRYMLSSQPSALYICIRLSHVDEGVAICGHEYAGRLKIHILSQEKRMNRRYFNIRKYKSIITHRCKYN